MHLIVVAALISCVFILWFGAQLPEHVGSHFGMSGQADAFMSRYPFVAVMLMATIIVPGLAWLLQVRAARDKKSNIPNRDYWFSDQNYMSTVRFLERHATCFALAFMAFMCTVHWLVVQANTSISSVPQLDNVTFIIALAVFMTFVIAWIAALYMRFARVNK